MTESERLAFKEVLGNAREITAEGLEELKKTETRRFFIIKYRDKLFLSYNISRLRPYLTSDKHQCTYCKRCIARPTEYGGCDKVYEIEIRNINKYPFIRLGVEAFNSREGENDFFAVTFCKNFLREPERKNTGTVCYPDKVAPKSKPYYTYTVTRPAPSLVVPTVRW
ncbi:MAG: hypothetical protein IKK43_05720 [Clostridia bacterium]|nr:hypothetical protein [Clostridia bacterium]